MRWLYNPDSVNLFPTDGPPECGQYEPCSCYCPPKFIKLMIWGEPIPA